MMSEIRRFEKRLVYNYFEPEEKYKDIYYMPYSLNCNRDRYPGFFNKPEFRSEYVWDKEAIS